jgi:hypothetical protein
MSVTLTQTQIIQSLGEALSWFERERAWGVPAAELRHLTGRIGELFAAMITRGQMALETNQRGYDVVGADGSRVSVKTVTSRHTITFNANTLLQADRVMILLLVDDPDKGLTIEELFYEDRADFMSRLGPLRNGVHALYLPRATAEKPDHALTATDVATLEGFVITRFENGSIKVEENGHDLKPAKPVLRKLAARLGIAFETASGTVKTTHQLGSHVIKAINLGGIG